MVFGKDSSKEVKKEEISGQPKAAPEESTPQEESNQAAAGTARQPEDSEPQEESNQAAAGTARQSEDSEPQEESNQAAAGTARQSEESVPQEESKQAAAGTARQSKVIPSLDVVKMWKCFKTSVKKFLHVFTNPAAAGKAFVADTEIKISLCVILLHALLSSIFSLLLTARLNAPLKESLGSLNSLLGGGGQSKGYLLSAPKAFFLTLLFSILGSALLFGLFLLAAMILKIPAYWRQVTALTAVRSVASIPFILLSWILVPISPVLGMGVFFGSVLPAFAFQLETVKGMQGVKENQALYMVFIVTAVFVLIYLWIFSKAIMLYMPSAWKSVFAGISDVLSDPSRLADLL